MTTNQEVSWNRSGGITTKGVYNWSPMFIKTVFKTTFGLSDVLKITVSALDHVNNFRGFTSNMWFDFKRLSSTIKSILITAILNKRTDDATTIPDKRVGTRSKFSPPPTFNVDNQVIFFPFCWKKRAIFQRLLGGKGVTGYSSSVPTTFGRDCSFISRRRAGWRPRFVGVSRFWQFSSDENVTNVFTTPVGY